MDFLFPSVVDSIDKVPEQFRPLYAAGEGGVKLKDSDPVVKGSVEAVVGLSKALKAARTEADNAKKSKIDLTPLKDYGEDPTTIATSVNTKLKELQDQIAKGGQAKIDLDALRADMTKSFNKEKEGLVGKTKALQDQLFQVLVENEARSAIAVEEGEDADLLMPFIKERVRVLDEDGKVKVYIVDNDGNRRYGSAGADMKINDLVREMKNGPKFSRLFKSSTPRGGGAPPGGAGGGKPRAEGEMTANQKIAAGLAKGQFGSGAGERNKK